ncbi:MAG: hypothetical protein MUE84_16685 [Hyphomonas sp.]|nr:hypothetical protein [Hyphomonas sp.]
MPRFPFAIAALAVLAACGQPATRTPAEGAEAPAAPEADAAGEVLNIYSARHYDSDKAMYARFEELSGIKVNVRESGAPELLEAMKAEGADSPADVIIVSDAGAQSIALHDPASLRPLATALWERHVGCAAHLLGRVYAPACAQMQ